MNIIKKMVIAAGTASVALAPIAASAATSAAPVLSARAAPASAEESDLRGNRDRDGRSGTGIILGVLAAALIILGIVIALDEDEDTPVSP